MDIKKVTKMLDKMPDFVEKLSKAGPSPEDTFYLAAYAAGEPVTQFPTDEDWEWLEKSTHPKGKYFIPIGRCYQDDLDKIKQMNWDKKAKECGKKFSHVDYDSALEDFPWKSYHIMLVFVDEKI